MDKIMTNKEFVEKAIDIANNYKTLYVMGCFGAPMTASNKKRYCNNNDYNKDAKRQKMINSSSLDTFGFDCVCLIKGILWGWNGNLNHVYGGATFVKNIPDLSIATMTSKSYSAGNSSNFSSLIVGELLYIGTGHIGIYIGDGLAVECTPAWKNKVQITAVGNIGPKEGYPTRIWKRHCKANFIEYVEDTNPTEPTNPSSLDNFLGGRGYLKYGDKGNNINKICLFFANNFYGYFGNTKESAKIKLVGKNGAGDFFGNYLKSWVMEFQKRCKVDGLYNDEIDGCIGSKTLKCLRHFNFPY